MAIKPNKNNNIQAYKKLDNEALKVYYLLVSVGFTPHRRQQLAFRSAFHEQDYRY